MSKKEFKTGAHKEVGDKLRFDLIPPEVDRALAEVLTEGAKKYSDRNWEQGIPYSHILAAVKRHINAFELGEEINTDDFNLHHLKHALTGLAFLVTFSSRNRDDLNDLPSYRV